MTAEELREKWKLEDELRVQLLQNLKAKLPDLKSMLVTVEGHWAMEDAVYRFYHGSFKVYRAQQYIEQVVAALRSLLPDREMDDDFLTIFRAGTGKEFTMEHNREWLMHTRPILEALFH